MRQFEVMLPPGWAQVDLTSPVAEPVKRIVKRMTESLPSDVAASARPHLERRFQAAMTGLAADGVSSAYLPVLDVLQAPVQPFIAVRPVSFDVDGEEMAPLDYLVALMAQPGASLVEPVGMVGVKRTSTSDTGDQIAGALDEVPSDIVVQADQAKLAEAAGSGRTTRHLHYVIGVPDDPERWMAVDASVSALGADSSDVLDAVEEFIDAWVTTVQWKEPTDA